MVRHACRTTIFRVRARMRYLDTASIGLTDGKTSAYIAHRQGYHWVSVRICFYKGSTARTLRLNFPRCTRAKYPLPEATLFSRAVRQGNQADTHDLSIINLRDVEPGLEPTTWCSNMPLPAAGLFDPVRAWRLGSDFNVPLWPQYVGVAPAERSRDFFSVDQPNVDIVAVKTLSEGAFRGEVTSAPLNPKVNKVFIVRLQEFAGRAANVKVTLPRESHRGVAHEHYRDQSNSESFTRSLRSQFPCARTNVRRLGSRSNRQDG